MESKPRVGILINGYKVQRWILEVLEKLVEYPEFQLVIIILTGKEKHLTENIFQKFLRNSRHLIYILYRRIDKLVFSYSPDAFERKKLNTEYFRNHAEIIELKNIGLIKSGEIDGQVYPGIKKLDLIINLVLNFLPGPLFDLSRNGIWSYHSGKSILANDYPPVLWDVFRKNEYGTYIKLISEYQHNGTHIRKLILNSHIPTDKVSLNKNSNRTYWKFASYLPEKIREFCESGPTAFSINLEKLNADPSFYAGRQNSIKNSRFLQEMAGFSMNLLTYKLKNLYSFDQWILMFRMDNCFNDFSKYTRILPPKDRFYADPFAIKREDYWYIFFEELTYAHSKGIISVIKLDQQGNFGKAEKVLEEDYHLSYPFLFEDNGMLYMIPESGENNTINLYRCIEFPLKWKVEINLMENINALDTTLYFHNNRYWLFTYVVPTRERPLSQGLYLFWSDNLLTTDWKSHPLNPVNSDPTYSRPAGNLFEYANNLYRPSQDCSKRYGYGIKINKIIELSETRYEERPVDSLYPEWENNLLGMHHINLIDNFCVIDVETRRKLY